MAKSLLTQKIPDSTLMKIHNKKTVKDHWDTIVREYTEKGTFAQTELRTCFLETQCQDKGDICQFLDDLCIKQEELATMGVELMKKITTPLSYPPFLFTSPILPQTSLQLQDCMPP